MSFFFRTFARKIVQRVKKYAAFCLIVLVSMACENRQPVDQVGKDLTVVFATTSGMTGDGYNELILQGVMEGVKAHPDISLHLLKPDSIGEARRQIEAWLKEATPKKGAAYYCVNLETNGEKFYNPDSGRKIDSAPAHRAPAAASEQKLRMAYCYCFKPNGDKIKFW